MIITRTPVRISLFGGSTDYNDFVVRNGYGLVVSAAINSYLYVGVKKLPPFFPYKTRVTYSQIECVADNRDIQHHAFKSALTLVGLLDEPLEINLVSDLPGRQGLGSSSALIVGLLKALHWYKFGFDVENNILFEAASFVEQKMMEETVGYQDYCPAIWGGLSQYNFRNRNGAVEVKNKVFNRNFVDAIEQNGLLIYTKQCRDASTVASHYVGSKDFPFQQKQQLRIAEEFIKSGSPDWEYIGYLMDRSWEAKRLIPGVSNDRLDEIYTSCYLLGARGRLLGSGGGGTYFLLCHEKQRKEIIRVCEAYGCVSIPFKVTERGSERIL